MKRIVLGTAGHIDHGKTLLTQALTGVDTDRLAEEKARGITIELGFAPMRLEDGTEISLVDVPGHERFVRTMMGGVSGVDGVLLLIAADDGVMPQTREHFDILRLLRLRRGIVVISKCDLVDPARLAQVRAQAAALTAGSFLENAPVCPVSAVTGEGLDALRREISALVARCEERSTDRPFRMCIDRVFPVGGFGSVATGTLSEGSVRTGSRVQLYPTDQCGSIRSLQTHGASVQELFAGMRTAMSFSALDRQSVQRGCTVAEPDSMLLSGCLTVSLEILSDCPYLIRNSSQLHLFHGTQEVVCRLRLLQGEALRAGQSGYAQLRLARPIAVRWGDRFLLRFFSPLLTIGGGTVLSCGEARLRRNQPEVLAQLARLADRDLAVSLSQRLEDSGLSPWPRALLRKYGNYTEEEYAQAEARLLSDGSAIALSGQLLLGADAVRARLRCVQAELARFHDEYPLQPGMRLSALRSRLFAEADAPVEALLALWAEDGLLKTEDGFAALPEFSPVFTQEHKIMQRRLLHYYRQAWFFAPDLSAVREKYARFGTLFEQVLANMRMNELLIPLTPRYWVHHEAYADALRLLYALGKDGSPVMLAQFRTAAGISRKYSQLFLEHWDRRGVTRRVGDVHYLTAASDADA